MERRCPDCGGELTACGEMTSDGPSDDCPLCRLRSQVNHWKANHDRVVAENRALKDRPDLGDRCRSVQTLMEKIAALEAKYGGS